MEVRDATEADVESVSDIYRYYVRTNICTLEENEPSVDAMRNDFSKIFAAASPFIVAVDRDSGHLAGYAYIGPFNERSGYRSTCEDSIYVHRDYQSKGIGKDLLHTLLTKLKASSDTSQIIAKMSILPEQTVQDLPSCHLHASFGFKPVGRLSKVGRKFDKWVDVVIMQHSVEA